MGSQTPPTVVPSDSRRIVIADLKRLCHINPFDSKEHVDAQSHSTTLSIVMHEDEPFSKLWVRIEGCRAMFAVVIQCINAEQSTASRNPEC